jgi:hypothetical protein
MFETALQDVDNIDANDHEHLRESDARRINNTNSKAFSKFLFFLSKHPVIGLFLSAPILVPAAIRKVHRENQTQKVTEDAE